MRSHKSSSLTSWIKRLDLSDLLFLETDVLPTVSLHLFHILRHQDFPCGLFIRKEGWNAAGIHTLLLPIFLEKLTLRNVLVTERTSSFVLLYSLIELGLVHDLTNVYLQFMKDKVIIPIYDQTERNLTGKREALTLQQPYQGHFQRRMGSDSESSSCIPSFEL